MTTTFDLTASLRTDQGKGASRRLRRLQDMVPGIVYGGKEKPTSIMLDHKKLMHALEHEAFYSHILTLHLPDNKKQQVVLKDLQRHHFKRALMHVDFLRVNATDSITMRVPLHFINENIAPGVKKGGQVSHITTELEIRCQANQLPEFIEVDLANLELDHSIHYSEIPLGTGIEIIALTHGTDAAVVSIHMPRTNTVDEAAAVAAEVPASAQKAPATLQSAPDKGKSKDKGK